jgi:guanine nucleotide-binding protein alpha-1 subunit
MRKAKSQQYHRRSLSDPLAAALLPPPDETPEQREQRLLAEYQAKKVSDGIDEMLRQEGSRRKKAAGSEVKVLLLGQSESGKSTTLKREYPFLRRRSEGRRGWMF